MKIAQPFAVFHGAGIKPELFAQQLLDALPPEALQQDCLGLIYATEQATADFDALEAALTEKLPHVQWVGAFADSIMANECEYGGNSAVAAMVMPLPADSWQIFSGTSPLNDKAYTAMVHADPMTPDLAPLVEELAGRTQTGYLFGGLTVANNLQATQIAEGRRLSGGLSGVGFDDRVQVLSRVTQGCSPLAGEHEITECRSQFVLGLDGRPALDVLLDDLGVEEQAGQTRDGDEILRALPADRLRNGLLVGLSDSMQDRPMGFGDYQVSNLVGIDPENRLLAIAARPETGHRLVFCTRDRAAARHDLIRACTELRDQIESESLTVLGAHYVSCLARGEALFGAAGAEAEILRHNLGEIPLIGFFANGEIARERLYGFTGVITLFVAPAP